MPELPEVEVLVRHLRPLLRGQVIHTVTIRREKILRPTTAVAMKRILTGARFRELSRRGKYLVFTLEAPARRPPITLVGHLGMTGRMFVARPGASLPKHVALWFRLDRGYFVFEDTRYFGRLTLDLTAIRKLGPEPLAAVFRPAALGQALKRSRQPVKVKLLDQALVAGIGNIYASEALFRARISPRRASNRLTTAEVRRLWRAIRAVLSAAIRGGSTVPLNFGAGKSDGLFYFGRAPGTPEFYEERLCVYDRAGQPCRRCATPIRRIVQAARSTFYCPACQQS